MMDVVGNTFFAGAAFTHDKHRSIEGADLFHQVEYQKHIGAVADNAIYFSHPLYPSYPISSPYHFSSISCPFQLTRIIMPVAGNVQGYQQILLPERLHNKTGRLCHLGLLQHTRITIRRQVYKGYIALIEFTSNIDTR